jgi:TubC N-terminal docking domain
VTAADLLRSVEARGVSIIVEGETLRFRAPRGVLTDELCTTIREHKAALIEEVETERALAWFATATLPTVTFALYPWEEVVEPARFFGILQGEISAGPNHWRWQTGATQRDVRRLWELFAS